MLNFLRNKGGTDQEAITFNEIKLLKSFIFVIGHLLKWPTKIHF